MQNVRFCSSLRQPIMRQRGYTPAMLSFADENAALAEPCATDWLEPRVLWQGRLAGGSRAKPAEAAAAAAAASSSSSHGSYGPSW
eukprot:scaffold270497_cov22-Prasinocladus_malaysianus.AAC.1